jgi:hypothetical protein
MLLGGGQKDKAAKIANILGVIGKIGVELEVKIDI